MCDAGRRALADGSLPSQAGYHRSDVISPHLSLRHTRNLSITLLTAADGCLCVHSLARFPAQDEPLQLDRLTVVIEHTHPPKSNSTLYRAFNPVHVEISGPGQLQPQGAAIWALYVDLRDVGWTRLESIVLVRAICATKGQVSGLVRGASRPVSFEMCPQRRDLAQFVVEDIEELADCTLGWKYSVVVEDLDAFVAWCRPLAALRAAPPPGVTFRSLYAGEAL